MGGLAGAIGPLQGELETAVRAMMNAQVHRGPKSEGLWTSAADNRGRGVILGFRGLTASDASPKAHQPMVDPATGNVIALDGEIYNFKELRGELEAQGNTFESESDTEVVLKAFRVWNNDAFTKCRGMFAIAVWDAAKHTVLLVRDRIGLKPLYMTRVKTSGNDETILFASELRALFSSNVVERRLNKTGVASYIWNGFVIGPETMIEGIELIPASTITEVNTHSGEHTTQQYWHIPTLTRDPNGKGKLRDELSRAANQHVHGQPSIGIFLSGGIDSSAVASLVKSSSNVSVKAFTLSLRDEELDESRPASEIARSLDIDHTVIPFDECNIESRIQHAITSFDQPSFDGLNNYFAAGFARDAGCSVVLTGMGGDDLFGGNRSFSDVPRAVALSRVCQPLPESVCRLLGSTGARTATGSSANFPSQTRWGKLSDVLLTRGDLVAAYQVCYGLFTSQFANDLLMNDSNSDVTWGVPNETFHEWHRLINSVPPLHAVFMLELACFVGMRLVRDIDSACMAASVEARMPLLDHKVIEACASIDLNSRFKPLGRKQLLRDVALSHLDDSLFDRPKRGFVLPIDRWCCNELKTQIEETMLDRNLCESVGLCSSSVQRLWNAFLSKHPGLYWSRVWSIFVLLSWCRHHRVSM